MMRLKHWFIACLVGSLILVGCTSQAASLTVADLPVGDATSGAALFAQQINGVAACTTCHSLDGSKIIGPSLKGYANVAGTRTDLAADAYTLQSIVQPASFTVPGFTNAMYGQYGQKLSHQQLADIIAYLLTLT
jgi:cytochrome c oxidase subunit 2